MVGLRTLNPYILVQIQARQFFVYIMKKVFALLDNVRSVFNVGSIFRTSDSAGLAKIFLCGITATPEHHKLAKTSLGAEKQVPWEHYDNSLLCCQQLQSEGFKIYVVELSPEAEYFDNTEYEDNCVLVVGHEVTGVDPEIIKLADKIIQIPMNGIKESLNVANAFAIVSYEATKSNRAYLNK